MVDLLAVRRVPGFQRPLIFLRQPAREHAQVGEDVVGKRVEDLHTVRKVHQQAIKLEGDAQFVHAAVVGRVAKRQVAMECLHAHRRLELLGHQREPPDRLLDPERGFGRCPGHNLNRDTVGVAVSGVGQRLQPRQAIAEPLLNLGLFLAR